MNKDVIYIEPEDDITDIISKIENSKEKIVALVPPKKTGILRSIVNIKLITKSGNNASKKIVLVTSDPAIMKLAATTKLPVTKDLQTPPAVPKLADIEAEEAVSVEEIVKTVGKDGEEEIVAEEITEETDDEKKDEEDKEPEDEKEDDVKDDEEKDDEGEPEEEGKKAEKDEEKPKKRAKKERNIDNPVLAWILEHKKLCIGLGIGLLLLILIMIWAFAIAPAVTVTVEVRTTTSNFSENISFTDVLEEENAGEGKFYLVQKKMETKADVEFEATGEKNVGEKASGQLIVWAYLPITGGSAYVSAGDIFTLGDLAYSANDDSTITWSGDLTNLRDGCANGKDNVSLTQSGCLIYSRISVTAVAPGTAYNIAASNTGWKAPVRISGAYSEDPMAGGTDEMITIVQQSDIDTALTKLQTSDENVNKEKLFDEIPDTSFIIDSSFSQTMGEPISTPKVGEQVKTGEKAKLSVITTSTVFFVDKIKIEEFITEKAKLAENYKVYSIKDPFVENFVKTEAGYTGKLKTSYTSGPKITENDIVETVRGKGIGTAQHDLMDINGIHNITIKQSYPWVSSVPNDPEKITVFIDIPSEQEE